ncbi:MerR family transcriptional regulator [Salinibacterium sp. dk2585]|uniref:MerR family transcriptional regulator n=1 Tax=unclassified Salinibacterium TaxID=2632331 RepID=UPI0011C24F4F|nr:MULTISPECIES: MerR family transcriptional regulator [unclassified Salinibacterium]QEE61351.1 MerR family transcriptional regulator [Salinibacterium sp. dk2585]TXK54028.1 MerR family transcriptional regulator [Salinibacterium sp. dk5596]
MAWSTREIADLAGTTVNTVRHYHRVGVLEEPDRMSNGYKKYEVRHLIRLLQIRRLRDLGVPVDRIQQVGFGDDTPTAALTAVDADLAKSIERLQRARAEISAILIGSSVTDLPPGFEGVASKLSKPERALMLIYSRLYDEEAMADLREMVESEPEDVGGAFDTLAPDADEHTRQRVAEQYAPSIARHLSDYHWLSDQTGHVSKSLKATQDTLIESVAALYNPAQLDVIVRASRLAHEQMQQRDADPADEGRASE